MSAPVDRFDFGVTVAVAGLAWYLDKPALLVGLGLGIATLSGLAESAGTRLGQRIAARRRERAS